jgi:Sensors of blue-light using FAD
MLYKECMAQLIQLIYISRSTFGGTEKFTGAIEPNAGQILVQARTNNRKALLTGVLCYGDGCFMQCLEGEEEPLNNLLAKLEVDPRHNHLTVLWQKPIKTRSFGRWEMKFVALEDSMMQWLELQGYQRFDPYQFDGQTIDRLLNFLGSAEAVLNFQGIPRGRARQITASEARER